jgi:hypothetical protein
LAGDSHPPAELLDDLKWERVVLIIGPPSLRILAI